MKRNIIKIEGIFLTASLLLSCLLVSCRCGKPRILSWKNADVSIEFLEPFTPEMVKTSPTTTEDIKKLKIEQFEVFQLPDKGYYYQIANRDVVRMLDPEYGTYPYHTIYPSKNKTYNIDSFYDTNQLLNPKTLLHPNPMTQEDKFPMELFVNQNKEKITVTKTKDIYTVSQNGKAILTCKFLAYLSPWVLGTNASREDKDKPWEYRAINTVTKEPHLLQLPGKVDGVSPLNQGFILQVTEQTFFNGTKWIYNPGKKNLIQIGGPHMEAVSVGDTSYIVFWDWYENIAKIFRYDQWREVSRIDFGRYQVKNIIPYQGKDKKWNLWMIPTLTYAKFTSNVFWMPLMVSRPAVTNMDFHKLLYVSQTPVDSSGRLLLFTHDNPTEDSTVGDLNSIFIFSAKRTKSFALPIRWKTTTESQRIYYDVAKFDLTTEEISFNTEIIEESKQPVTNKISPLNEIKLDDEKQPYTVFYTAKGGIVLLDNIISGGINQLQPNITEGIFSVKENTITWNQLFHYVLTREYKIPIGKLVPKK